MIRRAAPTLWFGLALILLALAGGKLLQSPRCIVLSERDRTSYGLMPQWRAHFDALSAVCGAGLLTHDLREEYTPLGRWVLAAMGVSGALIYLLAARAAIAPLFAGGSLPRARTIVIACVSGLGAAVAAGLVAAHTQALNIKALDAAWNAISAFSSLGWLHTPPEGGTPAVFVVLALLGALGWPAWVGIVRGGPLLRAALLTAATYALFLLVCAVLIALLEAPRAIPSGRRDARPAVTSSFPDRLARSSVQVAAAAGAGISTEKLADRAASEGTKALLATLLVVGAPGGSPGGGVKWTILLWAFAAAWAARRVSSPHDEAWCHTARVAVAMLLTVVLLTLIVAFGLLLIEGWTASAFQIAPTFADACLDAASAVAGGNLSSGLTATVTSATLSRGIHQNVDLYQYGMIWLMAAMLVGRVAPVAVLCCGARPGVGAASTRLPLPLI